MKKLILLYTVILLIISQTKFSQFLLFASFPLLVILILKHTVISQFGYSKILFLNLIVFLAFISGCMHLNDYNTYYFARDIMYFIQAPIFIILGIYLYAEIKDFKKLLKLILLSTLIITIYKLSDLLLHPNLIFDLGLQTRDKYDFSNGSALLSVIIIFYSRKLNHKLLSNKIEYFIIAISLFSLFISFSRTQYVLLIFISIIPFAIIQRKMIFKIFTLGIVAVFFILFAGNFMKIDSGGVQGDTFSTKVLHSLSEMTVKSYKTRVDINNNWRGFEAYLGLQKYYKGNPLEIFLGQGFGAVVYTPRWVFSGEKTNLGVLPMFHNGYVTIILKTGLVGLLFFFIWLYILLKTAVKSIVFTSNSQQKLAGLLLQAGVFIIFFQTFVIHGIFQTTPSAALLLLIGVSLQILSIKETNNKTIKRELKCKI